LEKVCRLQRSYRLVFGGLAKLRGCGRFETLCSTMNWIRLKEPRIEQTVVPSRNLRHCVRAGIKTAYFRARLLMTDADEPLHFMSGSGTMWIA
jgi:hypothetical protein